MVPPTNLLRSATPTYLEIFGLLERHGKQRHVASLYGWRVSDTPVAKSARHAKGATIMVSLCDPGTVSIWNVASLAKKRSGYWKKLSEKKKQEYLWSKNQTIPKGITCLFEDDECKQGRRKTHQIIRLNKSTLSNHSLIQINGLRVITEKIHKIVFDQNSGLYQSSGEKEDATLGCVYIQKCLWS